MIEKILQVFVKKLRIHPIWRILFLFLFASFEIHKLFLFLFIQKLAQRIYTYSYLRVKELFADHWIFLSLSPKKSLFGRYEENQTLKKTGSNGIRTGSNKVQII